MYIKLQVIYIRHELYHMFQRFLSEDGDFALGEIIYVYERFVHLSVCVCVCVCMCLIGKIIMTGGIRSSGGRSASGYFSFP